MRVAVKKKTKKPKPVKPQMKYVLRLQTGMWEVSGYKFRDAFKLKRLKSGDSYSLYHRGTLVAQGYIR